jgi:hypothetical protein
MDQLVTDSRFLMASPYSSQVCLTGLDGLLPFFEEKTMDRARSRLKRGSVGAFLAPYPSYLWWFIAHWAR